MRPDGAWRVWSGTQNPLWMRADLALLLDLPESAVEVIRMEAAGCYGRNCADDVTADAALLSRAVGRPVRVQLTREQEHQWEPKGAAQLMDVDGGLDAGGGVAAYDFVTRYPSNAAPTLALLAHRARSRRRRSAEMGDRTAIGPYDYANHRVVVPRHGADRARLVAPRRLGHAEQFRARVLDRRAAAEAGVDPVAYRLRYLKDARGRDLVGQVAARAGWVRARRPAHAARRAWQCSWARLRLRALCAFASFPASPRPGRLGWRTSRSIPATGEVSLTRVTVGQDSGLMINPDGVRHQIHGNVIQSTSRVLKEQVTFTDIAVDPRDWGTYPLLTFPEVPPIDVLMVPRPDEEPLGVGESASVPSAAAIANAIFDATGVRFREPPFTPERILAGCGTRALPKRSRSRGASVTPAHGPAGPTVEAGFARCSPLLSGPSARSASRACRSRRHRAHRTDPILSVFRRNNSARAHARGPWRLRPFAIPPRAAPLAGGLRHSDAVRHGLPARTSRRTKRQASATWSYPAFERAMREGVGRDGRHLFPAFPYTSFANATDFDCKRSTPI